MEESTPPTSTANVVDTAQCPQGDARSNSENSNFRTSGSNSSRSSGYGGKLPSTAQKDINRTNEDNGTSTSMTNAVDSAYSQSNSRSLSSQSSQCRMRASNSSGSSGYGGKQSTFLSPVQAENSASSGNSGELTTVKNLKRSKNKGRKKKAKTKQSQNRSTKLTESIQEVQTQDATTNEKSSIDGNLAQTSAQPTDVKNTDETNATGDDAQNSANKQTTAESDILQKKSNHDLSNTIPMSTNEPLKEKIDQNLEEENSSGTDKSPNDLEVDGILSNPKADQPNSEHRNSPIQESFCCAVSMHDGVILSTTANLTDSLGFPKDVWLGRAFIDFVHPKDRPTFASQITEGYMDHLSLKPDYLRQSTFEQTPLYVLLRCYRGFDTCGFAVKSRPVTYKPFKLIFRKPPDMLNPTTKNNNSALRIICAIALSSIYKVPDEAMKNKNAKFSTRHTAAGILVHIDGTAVTAIGWMPQDILGESILDFFHPEDMIMMKTAYEMLMKNTQVADGRVSTPPYRFLIKNGSYITLETEWTRVFNPWSRKLEFVTGDHCVLRGPKYCDIFEKKGKYACQFSNEILEKAVTLKKGLLKILSEPIPYPTDSVKQQVSKRCQALASFMESLLSGVQRQELKLDLLPEYENPQVSEHGSVMLGEISPHHHSNYEDSKSSSESPPTYNQLNYFENLNRFFNSVHPTFVPNDFTSLPHQIDHVPTNERDRMLSPIQQAGEESGGSFNSSSDSPPFDSTNTSNTSNNGHTTKPHLLLTEVTVCRHTDEMEMQMVKNHKKYRTRNSHMADKKKAPDKVQPNAAGARNQPMKRSWPTEMGNELSKNSKTNNLTELNNLYPKNANENAQINDLAAQSDTVKAVPGDADPTVSKTAGQSSQVQAVNLWPPFSVNASTMKNNIPTNTIPNPINQFLLSNHLSAPRYYVPSANPNSILTMNTNVFEPPPPPPPTPYNMNATQNFAVNNLPNPYALEYLKNFMCQTRPFVAANMTYPYAPNAYQTLPVLPQKPIVTPQVYGTPSANAIASNAISVEMPSTSQQARTRNVTEPLPNMAPFENTDNSEPVNLTTTNTDKIIPKLQVKPWANMKDDSSEEVDASNSSFGSSFFDSQLRTDESYESDKASKDDTMAAIKELNHGLAVGNKKRIQIPHWMKNIQSTPDLVLRYQVRTKEVEEVLKSDLRVLKEINQPDMVNEQLNQLYLDLDLELESQGQVGHIKIGDTPTNSSEDEENMSKKKKNTHFSKLSLIYEENAPVQPPVEM